MRNLKIYISVDIEGVAGICNWNETTLGHAEYAYFQKEMVNETVACCKALIEEGITDITVRDAHDSARNLIPSLLPECVKLIRGWTGAPCDMMAGLDETYDGVVFIGYHSQARSNGNPLSHTLTTSLNHIKINGSVVSEFLLNTYYARLLNVPVIMVVGDQTLTEQVKNQNKFIETVATNTGIHGGIMAIHPNIVDKAISETTKKAINTLKTKKEKLLIVLPRVFDTEIHFRTHAKAYSASFYPGASALNADKTVHTSNNFMDTLKFIKFTT